MHSTTGTNSTQSSSSFSTKSFHQETAGTVTMPTSTCKNKALQCCYWWHKQHRLLHQSAVSGATSSAPQHLEVDQCRGIFWWKIRQPMLTWGLKEANQERERERDPNIPVWAFFLLINKDLTVFYPGGGVDLVIWFPGVKLVSMCRAPESQWVTSVRC